MFRKFLFIAFLLLGIEVFAEGTAFENEKNEVDMDALRKWLYQKRMITVKELGGDLSLSGEVRVEMQGFNEKRNGVQQRGRASATDKPEFAFDVEADIMLDYRTERTWSSVKLKFDNDMGQISGTTDKISLSKAYLGGRFIAGDTFSFDGEIGRRNLYLVFESKIEYGSLFDGLLFRFNKASADIGDFYCSIGSFLINDKINQFGYVGELGFLRIGNTGCFVKYSLIDWKKHFNNEIEDLRFNFIISQLILGYQYMYNGMPVRFYAAGLINQVADKIAITNYKKKNLGGYIGFSIGQIRKKHDWSLDTNYQIVQAQAIPDYDANGIGRGNAQNVGFYTTNMNGTGAPTTIHTAVGKSNYQGVIFEFLYAITNNITLYQGISISENLDKSIGPMLRYKMFEMEIIYAF